MPARRAEEKRTGEAGRFARSVLGDQTALFMRVDPCRDVGIQIPPTGSEVDRSDEDPIIPVQRRLDEIVNLSSRLFRLRDPGRVQNLACLFELVDLLFNQLVVLSRLMKVVCDDVEGRCRVHGFPLVFVLDVRAGGQMASVHTFIHGTADELVPYEMGLQNYTRCHTEKQMLTVEGAAHCCSYYVDPVRYISYLDAFLKKYRGVPLK